MGIAQIAITPSPPALKRALWGTFFWAIFYHSEGLDSFSLNKCPKPSGQGFRPPQHQANARLNLENSSIKKCPKPSGQGFRPSPPNGQCPNRGGDILKGASLRWMCVSICMCVWELWLKCRAIMVESAQGTGVDPLMKFSGQKNTHPPRGAQSPPWPLPGNQPTMELKTTFWKFVRKKLVHREKLYFALFH